MHTDNLQQLDAVLTNGRPVGDKAGPEGSLMSYTGDPGNNWYLKRVGSLSPSFIGQAEKQ